MEREFIDPSSLRSTYDDYSNFRVSNIWVDMLGELHTWIQQIREIQDGTDVEKELFRCQGRIEAIEYFQRLPDVLMAAIETAVEESNAEREDDSDESPESMDRYGR